MDDLMGQASWPDLNMIVVGYGVSDPTIEAPPDFQLDAERHSGLESIKNLSPYEISTLQTRKPESNVVYYGDSGGPLFHVDDQGNEVLVGLVSCIDPYCLAWPAVYYRLDTASVQVFIYDTLPSLVFSSLEADQEWYADRHTIPCSLAFLEKGSALVYG
jgi:hypothetical protein